MFRVSKKKKEKGTPLSFLKSQNASRHHHLKLWREREEEEEEEEEEKGGLLSFFLCRGEFVVQERERERERDIEEREQTFEHRVNWDRHRRENKTLRK